MDREERWTGSKEGWSREMEGVEGEGVSGGKGTGRADGPSGQGTPGGYFVARGLRTDMRNFQTKNLKLT